MKSTSALLLVAILAAGGLVVVDSAAEPTLHNGATVTTEASFGKLIANTSAVVSCNLTQAWSIAIENMRDWHSWNDAFEVIDLNGSPRVDMQFKIKSHFTSGMIRDTTTSFRMKEL